MHVYIWICKPKTFPWTKSLPWQAPSPGGCCSSRSCPRRFAPALYTFISHNALIWLFFESQLPHRIVNLLFGLVIVSNELKKMGSWLSKNIEQIHYARWTCAPTPYTCAPAPYTCAPIPCTSALTPYTCAPTPYSCAPPTHQHETQNSQPQTPNSAPQILNPTPCNLGSQPWTLNPKP